MGKTSLKKKSNVIRLVNEYAPYSRQQMEIQQDFNWNTFFFLGFYCLYKQHILPLAFVFAFVDTVYFYSLSKYLLTEINYSYDVLIDFGLGLVGLLFIRFFIAIIGGIQMTKYYMLKGYRIDRPKKRK